MSVHEDPDRLGYWKEPLGRSAAQEDIQYPSGGGGRESAPAAPVRGYHGEYLYGIMSAPMQNAIVMASQYEDEDAYGAEIQRGAAGYGWDIDPGWG